MNIMKYCQLEFNFTLTQDSVKFTEHSQMYILRS